MSYWEVWWVTETKSSTMSSLAVVRRRNDKEQQWIFLEIDNVHCCGCSDGLECGCVYQIVHFQHAKFIIYEYYLKKGNKQENARDYLNMLNMCWKSFDKFQRSCKKILEY